jgi:hypothetical protein
MLHVWHESLKMRCPQEGEKIDGGEVIGQIRAIRFIPRIRGKPDAGLRHLRGTSGKASGRFFDNQIINR